MTCKKPSSWGHVLGFSALAALAGCAATPQPASDPPGRGAYRSLRLERPRQERGAEPEAQVLPELGPDADMGDFVRYALLENPGLRAAYQESLASEERVTQVSAMPDPRFSYWYYIQEVETRVGPQQHAIGLSQTFPWFGKLDLQQEVASGAAAAARERFEAQKNRLVAQVVEAYLEYYHLGRAVTVVRGNRDLVQHLERVARARFGAGAASHPDVVRAQVELGQLENQLTSLEDRRGPLAARLNASLGRHAEVPIAFPQEVPVVPLGVSDEQVLAWVAEANPDLLAIRHEIQAAGAAGERAARDAYPDITLGVDYFVTGHSAMSGVRGSGDDALRAGISLSLPISQGKYGAAVRESEARQVAATLRHEDLVLRFEAEASTALFRLRDAHRQVALYRDTLLPKARESLVTTQAAYTSGNATFTDLVDAQRVLLSFELSFERAVTDHGQRRAELERLVGRVLPATSTAPEHEGIR